MPLTHPDFEVVPKIVRADHDTVLAIRPLAGRGHFLPECVYTVTILPAQGSAARAGDGYRWGESGYASRGDRCANAGQSWTGMVTSACAAYD